MSSQTCFYVSLISNHLVAILQILNVKYSDSYVNNIITTKCLNTAVMLTIILLGESKIKHIKKCDVSNTIQRHINKEDNNLVILEQLRKTLLRKNSKYSTMYYIMLTDGNMYNMANDKIYFPGHVFLVEKNVDGGYYIYQSFIQKYSLREFIKSNKCSSFRREDVKNMCSFFSKFLRNDYKWDDIAIQEWCKLTSVDTSKFKTFDTNNIYLCFKKFTVRNIKKKLESFVSKSIIDIQRSIQDKNLTKYNSTSYLNNSLSSKPYDIHTLEIQFKNLQIELIKYKDK